MAYNVKLKNQTGTEVNYEAIEQVTIPLSSGMGNATFVARYDVTKVASAYITYYGGDTAGNGVDYTCCISTGGTGKNVPDSITLTIGGKDATANVAYVYTKVSNTEAVVKVNGSYITGAIGLTAVAV